MTEVDQDPQTSFLVERAQTGDPRWFDELYARLAPALHGWASLRIRRDLQAVVDPEEIVQETWFRAFSHLADFEPDRGAFRSWIFGYARMVLMEALRKARPAGARGRSELFEESYPDAVTTFTRRIARDEAMQRFLDCMHGLGEDEKTLVILCGLEGQSCADAAERLGISHDAALKRWQRLRADIASRGWTQLLAEDS